MEETEGSEESVQTAGLPPAQRQVLSKRIYILGAGNVGKFVAHSLAGVADPPPVTLLLRRWDLLKRWNAAGKAITLVTNNKPEKRRGIVAESIDNPTAREDIHHLIVATKGPDTVKALQSVQHRLLRESSVLFLQNGMGIMDEVNNAVFPDENERPKYMVGTISHGISATNDYFKIVHAGHGTTAIGALDGSGYYGKPDSSLKSPHPINPRYMLRTLTRTPILAAAGFHEVAILQLQLEKLAVNAIINPMTATLDCRNGELLDNSYFSSTMRLLLAEISLVLRSLPELQGVPNIEHRFGARRLETLVVSTAKKTAFNVSSMLQDTRRGVKTEIDYINGYIIKRGEQLGIKCYLNLMLVQMLQGRSRLEYLKREELLPFEKNQRENRDIKL